MTAARSWAAVAPLKAVSTRAPQDRRGPLAPGAHAALSALTARVSAVRRGPRDLVAAGRCEPGSAGAWRVLVGVRRRPALADQGSPPPARCRRPGRAPGPGSRPLPALAAGGGGGGGG